VLDGEMSSGSRDNFLAVKYLGITPEAYDSGPVLSRHSASASLRDRLRSIVAGLRLQRREHQIVSEMMELVTHLREKKVL
jgi:hypothetical protein